MFDTFATYSSLLHDVRTDAISPIKSQKRLACDMFDTFATYSILFHGVRTDAYCWAQRSSIHNHVFVAFKHWLFNKQDKKPVEKLVSHFFHSIAITRACRSPLTSSKCSRPQPVLGSPQLGLLDNFTVKHFLLGFSLLLLWKSRQIGYSVAQWCCPDAMCRSWFSDSPLDFHRNKSGRR